MSAIDLETLQALHTWMAANGVRRAKSGDCELELFEARPVVQRAAPERESLRVKTTDEIARERREERRLRYRREFGHDVTDEALDRLP